MTCFEQLSAFLDAVPERYGIPGCDCAVARDGEIIFRHSVGFSDPNGTVPVSPNDTYWIYSATKLFTCTAAMRLIEEGKLKLDAPVSDYLPEFGALSWKAAPAGNRPRSACRGRRNRPAGADDAASAKSDEHDRRTGLRPDAARTAGNHAG